MLRGRVPVPDVYQLRVGRQSRGQLVPLTGRAAQLTGQVAEAGTSTHRASVYLVRPSGSPEVVLLQALQPYAPLCDATVGGPSWRAVTAPPDAATTVSGGFSPGALCSFSLPAYLARCPAAAGFAHRLLCPRATFLACAGCCSQPPAWSLGNPLQ